MSRVIRDILAQCRNHLSPRCIPNWCVLLIRYSPLFIPSVNIRLKVWLPDYRESGSIRRRKTLSGSDWTKINSSWDSPAGSNAISGWHWYCSAHVKYRKSFRCLSAFPVVYPGCRGWGGDVLHWRYKKLIVSSYSKVVTNFLKIMEK